MADRDLQSLLDRYPALPEAYVRFLKQHDGGEGWFATGRFYKFWQASEIEQSNLDYGAPEFSPGFLLFGSDGGDESLAFDMRSEPWMVGELPFVSVGDTDFLCVGTFEDFIATSRVATGSDQSG
ncbi:SMI1/KNR4 family protein [Luteibacter yeojuensis]|uniref:SMI1/KNR4 family protein n=1 Tax=Luteibacter yeojuensis TaxID=345309 RepID=UPI0018DDFD0A|nr:SMI1/KNR4 family protein [Luteibacter yeojuensis]